MPTSPTPTAQMFRLAWTSPALRAAVTLTPGGVACALGNLAPARMLPKEQYGRFALVLRSP